jgi:hypothetical protein
MYRVRSGVALALALTVIGNCAHAERLQPGSPLSGYQCYHIDAGMSRRMLKREERRCSP